MVNSVTVKECRIPPRVERYIKNLDIKTKKEVQQNLEKYYGIKIKNDIQLYEYVLKFQREIYGKRYPKLIDGMPGPYTVSLLRLAVKIRELEDVSKKLELPTSQSSKERFEEILYAQRTAEEIKNFLKRPYGYTSIFYLSNPELFCRFLEELVEKETGKKVTVEWYGLGLGKDDQKIFYNEISLLIESIERRIKVDKESSIYIVKEIISEHEWKLWNNISTAFRYIKIKSRDGEAIFEISKPFKNTEGQLQIKLTPVNLTEEQFYREIEYGNLINIDTLTKSITWFLCKFYIKPEKWNLQEINDFVNKIEKEYAIVKEIANQCNKGDYKHLSHLFIVDKKNTMDSYLQIINTEIENIIEKARGTTRDQLIELKNKGKEIINKCIKEIENLEKLLKNPYNLLSTYKNLYAQLDKEKPKSVRDIIYDNKAIKALEKNVKDIINLYEIIKKLDVTIYNNLQKELREASHPENWIEKFYYDALYLKISLDLEKAAERMIGKGFAEKSVIDRIKKTLYESTGEKRIIILDYLKTCNLFTPVYTELRNIENGIEERIKNIK